MKAFLKKLVYTLTLTVIFGYGVYTIAEQQVIMDEGEKERGNYLTLREEGKILNEQLTEEYQSKDSDEYKEKIARDRGFIGEDQIIFVLKGLNK